MKMPALSLRITVLCAVVGVSLISIATLTVLQIMQGRADARLEHTQDLQNIAAAIDNALEAKADVARGIAVGIAGDETALSLWAAGDRAGLQALLAPRLALYKERFGVSNIVFQEAPATPFLRVHKPDRFGDDISAGRPELVKANTERVELGGIAYGKLSGLSVRAMMPAFKDGRFLGVVDIGFAFDGEFGSNFLRNSLEGTGAEAAIYSLQDGVLERRVGTEDASRIDTEMVNKALAGDPVRRDVELDERHYSLLAVPLPNILGEPVAVVAISIDKTEQVAMETRNLLITLGTGAVILIISIVIGLLVTAPALRALRRVVAATTGLAGGDIKTEISDTKRRDEVGELARSLEIFRGNMAERAEAEAQQLLRQEAAEKEKSTALAALAGEVEDEGGALVERIRTDLDSMVAESRQILENMSRVQDSTRRVASGADNSLAKTNTVASAAEQLAASSAEIASEV
ncbi:MAG: cache domain-containing protein, partial [Pseudomonadota bacterium]